MNCPDCKVRMVNSKSGVEICPKCKREYDDDDIERIDEN